MKRGSLYQFGSYRQDADARLLTRLGEPVAITPKAFDILLFLVSNSGRTVSRAEVMREIWPDTFVEPGSLTYNISQLRKILGEYSPGVPYIQTHPKHGYRFVADVTEPNGSRPSEPHVASKPASKAPRMPQAWPVRLTAMVAVAAVAAAITASFLPSRANDNLHAASLVRLTSDSGLAMTPALSPDGKLVAYASDRAGAGNLDIWVQQVGGAEPIRLTRDQADDYDPSFSPDGRTIAFRSERQGGGIYVVSALGGEARKIATNGRRPKFSPDGMWIAYWVGTEVGDSSAFFLTPGAGKVYIVPSAGGTAKEIGPEFASAGYPIWTPDGAHVLFLANRDPQAFHTESAVDWFVTPIDGGAAVATGASAVFRSQGFPTVSQAPQTWTADGTGVLMSARLANTRNIWRVPISTRNWKASGVARRMTDGTIMDLHPAIAGETLVFASLSESVDVWSLDTDTERAKPAKGPWRLTQDPFVHGSPTVSPDGTRVAFCSRRSGTRDIWIKDLQSGTESVVSNPPGPSGAPHFSPKGDMVVYKVKDVAYAWSSDGVGTRQLCDDCTDYSWSSDEKRLLVLGKSPARVSVLDLASGRRTPLLDHHDYVLWNPCFSPDDRWVSFTANQMDRGRIFVAPFRSAGMIPQSEWIAIADRTEDDKPDDKPRWSRDGNVLYFISERDGFRCIWAQRLDARKHPAGPAFAVFHAHDARRSLGPVGPGDLGLSIARDKIVFNMSERTGNIWMANLEPGR